jgi:hypothetical protein
MRGILLVSCLSVLFSLPAFSQSYESKIEYSKKKQDAFAIDYAYSPEAVENAIVNRMEKLGYKTKEEKGLFNKDKGFRTYKNAFISDISSTSFDYVVKVEQKSRKDKNEAVLYLVILKDGNNAKAGFEAADVERAKTFLNNLQPDVEAADLELQIIAQEEVVVKAEKKLKGLKSDKEDMEKKIQKLQDDIKKNEKDQTDTQQDIENQKVNLETLRGKRKNNI